MALLSKQQGWDAQPYSLWDVFAKSVACLRLPLLSAEAVRLYSVQPQCPPCAYLYLQGSSQLHGGAIQTIYLWTTC